MEIDLDLNDVVEKPLLPADREMTFAIIKAEIKIGKQPNEKTGKQEPYFNCELAPLDPEFAGRDYKVYHIWSTTYAANEQPDATISLRKFLEIIGKWKKGTSLKPSTELLQTCQFVGKLRYDDSRPNFPRLAAVLRGAN